jgi:hypothetical protein
MKTETVMLIADAKLVLDRVARKAATDNPLAAAFASWLCPARFDATAVSAAAQKASNAKGGERSSRGVAVLGFACAVPSLRSKYEATFRQHLDWLTGRPNFGSSGEPSNVLLDPLILLGVCVGANTVLNGEPKAQFDKWAHTACKDAIGVAGESGWQRGVFNMLGAWLNKIESPTDVWVKLAPAWMRAALNSCGCGKVGDTEAADVLKVALLNADAVSDGFEAVMKLAAIDWATARAIDFNLDAMTIADVARVLNNVTSIFQRWTWEEKPRTARIGALAQQWRIENEYHIQSLLYAVVKPIFPALEEERYLAPTGTYQPRADLSLLSLQLLIELKFWYQRDSAKHLIEEIGADLTLYLRKESPYRQVIAVIWDDGARTEEHTELRRGLLGLGALFDVIIINRPAFMNKAGVSASVGKKKRKRSTPRSV